MSLSELLRHNDTRLDAKEAAVYLGRSPSALTTWRARAQGPKFFFLGRQVFYWKSDLDEFKTNLEEAAWNASTTK